MTRHTLPGPFRSILCPVDFSEHARAALRHAAALAAAGRGRVTALFVNDPLLVAAGEASYDARLLAASTEAELRRFVKTSLPAAAARAVRYATAVGTPGPEILKLAATQGADLIVMGTHGTGAAGRLFFGSVTDAVLRNAPVPMLAVPPAASRRRPRAPRASRAKAR